MDSSEASHPPLYAFVSYARQEEAYVSQLVRHLADLGIEAWIDGRIEYGATWPAIIKEKIDGCAAFIVLMTPEGEESTWVNREIRRAEQVGKPILPLLLDGLPFFQLNTAQYHDVSDRRMPAADFTAHLRQFVGSTESAESDLPRSVATMDSQIVAETVLGRSWWPDRAAAMRRLVSLRSKYVTSRQFEEEPDDRPSVLLWVSGYGLRPGLSPEDYRGHYIQLTVVPARPHGWFIQPELLHVPTIRHPVRPRHKTTFPNWGHPVLRQVVGNPMQRSRRVRGHRTREGAEDALHLLQREFPDASTKLDDQLRLMIFHPRGDGPRVRPWALRIKRAEDDYYIEAEAAVEADPPVAE